MAAKRSSPSRRKRAARRRKRRMDRVEHDLTDAQWVALQDAWGGCAYCGAVDTPLQRDCVLALSRGGRYTVTNVVPACRSCNASKCNAEVTSWMRRRRLDEPTFLLRHLEISTALAPRRDAPHGLDRPTGECPGPTTQAGASPPCSCCV
jgi:5-methylcytosine-specific restriction endonuclease McrA